MKLAGWNGRGLGNSPAVQGLLDLRKREDPDVLFLSETKMKCGKLEWLRWKLEMPNMMVKDCVGQSDGLAIFWKRDINLRVLPFMSKYHIDTEIT
jgi:exonuclease III